jgi:hypothetical protein
LLRRAPEARTAARVALAPDLNRRIGSTAKPAAAIAPTVSR